MALRCRFGIHKYQQNKRFTPDYIFPFDGSRWERVCLLCGKRQRWLPGYGGSEDGCWITMNPTLP